MDDHSTDRITSISASYNVRVSALAVFVPWFGLCGSVLAVGSNSSLARIVFLVVGLAAGVVLVRWARSRVRVSAESVEILGIVRHRVVPRSEVCDVRIDAAGLPWWPTPTLSLKDGREIRIGFLCDTGSSGRGKASELLGALADPVSL